MAHTIRVEKGIKPPASRVWFQVDVDCEDLAHQRPSGTDGTALAGGKRTRDQLGTRDRWVFQLGGPRFVRGQWESNSVSFLAGRLQTPCTFGLKAPTIITFGIGIPLRPCHRASTLPTR